LAATESLKGQSTRLQLLFEQRLENPPEFPDTDVECGLKALVFKLQS
jgi:hypothetical protein